MPRRRIPTFEKRLEALCDEAGLPRFDRTDYRVLGDVLFFLWDDPCGEEPKFVIGVPLASASIHGMTADDLRGAWERKFGPTEAAEAA
ncbi:MAG: hypothetical protein Q7T55_19260 [Solirubrobacteraceae bacterium]|nr:hypothetical protein [Solirubrobacteraceae bacterium]